MPRFPRHRTALLFAIPLMAHAGALAFWPPDEATLGGVLPRLMAVCAAACAVAWVAAPTEDGRVGTTGTVASLALATLGAGAFAFVGCLAYALAFAGQLGAVVFFGLAFFAVMAATGAAILVYVLSSATGSPPLTVALAMTLHVAVLAPLLTHPSRVAAGCIAAAACASLPLALVLARRDKKKPAP
ncbi:MAG TPA: hypothetical protein VL426_00635 [Candidatus Binatia bacterium]|jgi:hypothetical protein|nr:hypothetical protein [Candidatus Binatia bacterium]